MNETSYFPNNKRTLGLARKIVAKYKLKECYNNNKNEQVYINDSVLFCVEKEYIFMRSLTVRSNNDYWTIRKELMR